jgi:outer membrane biosynthesis protein TonB
METISEDDPLRDLFAEQFSPESDFVSIPVKLLLAMYKLLSDGKTLRRTKVWKATGKYKGKIYELGEFPTKEEAEAALEKKQNELVDDYMENEYKPQKRREREERRRKEEEKKEHKNQRNEEQEKEHKNQRNEEQEKDRKNRTEKLEGKKELKQERTPKRDEKSSKKWKLVIVQ